jgi:hypothetical protein
MFNLHPLFVIMIAHLLLRAHNQAVFLPISPCYYSTIVREVKFNCHQNLAGAVGRDLSWHE